MKMDTLPLLLVFFGGLLLVFLSGRLLGHIFRLDRFFDDSSKIETAIPYRTRNKRRNKGKKDLSGTESKSNLSKTTEWRRWWNPAEDIRNI